MLQTVRKQWGTLPRERDRAGIQAQAQRASPNPKRPHSEGWTSCRTIPAPGAPGEGARVQARLPAATHPRSPGSIPGARSTADAHFLIKGLAYGVKTPLPSPTRAPTLAGRASCQLPAPWVHSQPPARTAGGGLDRRQGQGCRQQRAEAGQAQLLSQHAIPPRRRQASLRCDRNSHRQGDSLFSLSLLSDLCCHLKSPREAAPAPGRGRGAAEEKKNRSS